MSEGRALLLVLVLALGLRGLGVWLAADAHLVKDEQTYHMKAQRLLDGDGYVGSFRSWVVNPGKDPVEMEQFPGALQPPGYPTFLAGCLWIGGGNLTVARILQSLLGVGVVALIYRVGADWLGTRVGLAAAAVAAVYPNLIAFSHLFWSETLFLALLLGAVAFLRPGVGLRGWAAAGFLLGLAILTRASLVYLAPVLLVGRALVESGARGRALVGAALAVLVLASTLAPWSVRNTRVHGGFVLVDTNGPYNLWRGNSEGAFEDRGEEGRLTYPPPFESIPLHPVGGQQLQKLIHGFMDGRWKRDATDLEIMAYAEEEAWSFIRADPGAFVGRMVPKLVDLWNPTSFLTRHLAYGAEGYGELSPWLRGGLRWAAILSYLAVWALALPGLWIARRSPLAWGTVGVVLFYSALAAVAFGLTRFRMPAMPFLILMAAPTIVALRDRFGPAVRSDAPPAPNPDAN